MRISSDRFLFGLLPYSLGGPIAGYEPAMVVVQVHLAWKCADMVGVSPWGGRG